MLDEQITAPSSRRLLRAAATLAFALGVSTETPAQTPNVVVILADDVGYGDVGPYDHDEDPQTPEVTNTPVLDQMAVEGVTMTDFYANSPVCSPTRAALLTGRHSIRSGITWVFVPNDPKGLPQSEITIAEMLQPLGYRTAMIGKWHLGDAPQYSPIQQGFDYFYGVPYSNNSLPFYIIQNTTIVTNNPDQSTLTRNFTTEAKQFISDAVAQDAPFFLYMAHTVAHIPLFVSAGFEGITGRGVYADAMYEMDWSVGQILSHLESLGVDQDTLVVFTSDNGACNSAVTGPEPPNHPAANQPWRWTCGRNNPLAGYKQGFLEGGLRVPFVARWPGVLPVGAVRTTVGSVLDILPTVAGVTGAPPPKDREIDGSDLFGVWTVDAPRASEELYFYRLFSGPLWGTREQVAVRCGPWKQSFKSYFENAELYDVANDPSETTPVQNPLISASLNDRGRSFDCGLDDPFVPWTKTKNLALRRPAWGSSSQLCDTSRRGVDGDENTSWISGPGGPQQQWLDVDLDTSGPMNALAILKWGSAHAVRYTLQVSDDRQLWTDVHVENAGNGGIDLVPLLVRERYLRVNCLESATSGYELRELAVLALSPVETRRW